MEKLIYRVRKEETIADIASRFGLSLQSILSDNHLKEAKIEEGMRLLLIRREGVRYVVKPFENIASIAAKFETTPEQIRKKNNLAEEGEVFIGQIVYI